MKINVSNMPINTLYKFDDNKYVMALMLKETREGGYPSNKASRFTEVYQIDDTGFISRIASGKLIDNPSVYDFDKLFAIKDMDMDTIMSFAVTKPLKEVNLNELYQVKEAISKSNSIKNK